MNNNAKNNATNINNSATVKSGVSKKRKNIELIPTMDLKMREKFCKTIMNNASCVGRILLAEIPIELMVVDKTYQRDQVGVEKIACDWDDDKCGVITVAFDHENYVFKVIEGQRRTCAAMLVGIETLTCHVKTGMTLSSQAAYFADYNSSRIKLNPFELFKADQLRDENDDNFKSIINKTIKRSCDKYNITVSKTNKPQNLRALTMMQNVVREDGKEGMDFILDVAVSSGFFRSECLKYEFVNAVNRVYKNNRDDESIAKRILIDFFTGKTTQDIYDCIASEKYRFVKTPGARWANLLIDVVNDGKEDFYSNKKVAHLSIA